MNNLTYDKEVLEKLLVIKNNNRLSHAYIFKGYNISKMHNTALLFSTYFYQDNDKNNILNNNHLNIITIDILEDKKSISKEQIIALEEDLSYTSLVAGPRFIIINNFDTATIQAQNSLLKIVEEPKTHEEIYFIFITTNYEEILDTIKSRSITINFKLDSKFDLMNKYNYPFDDKYILGILEYNNIKYNIVDKEYIEFKDKLKLFLELNSKFKALIYFNTINLTNIEFKNLIIILINIYEDALNNLKLNEGFIYDKIKIITNMKKNYISRILYILLDINNKLNYNLNYNNLFHNLIINMFEE